MLDKRNDQIDNLRGYSALLIAVFHIFYRYLQIYHPGMEPGWMMYFGDVGICIFIIVTGFFLKASSTGGKKESVVKFYFRKIIRLWPLYFLCISITWVCVYLFGLPGREVSFVDYLLNIPFVNGFIGRPYVDGAHWYLTTIISLFFVYGFISCILKKEKTIIVYIIWFIVCDGLILFGKPGFAQFIGGQYLGNAVCGLALRNVLLSEGKKERYSWGCLIVLCFISIVAVRGISGVICHSIGFLIVALAATKRLWIVSNQLGGWLSIISFSLYLIHQNIAYLIIYSCERVIGNYNVLLSVVALALVIILAIPLSAFERKAKIITDKATRCLFRSCEIQ